jgi:hypothetical protein
MIRTRKTEPVKRQRRQLNIQDQPQDVIGFGSSGVIRT